MGSIATYIADKAAKKKQTPVEWLESNLKNLDRYWVSSHIGKYTHPDVAVHLHDDSGPTGKGYLTTTDTAVQQDIYVEGGSAFMTIASFLVSRFSQKESIAEQKDDLEAKTAWQYFREDSPFIRREIESLGIKYEPLREKILRIQISKIPEESDERLKQVYFPIPDCDGEYHLLSILPPSVLMLELTNRIRMAFQVQRKCQDKKSECYGGSYQTFSDLTNVRFGGANVQNVSTRNSSLGIQVLPSLPPCLTSRKIKMPKRNFFFDSLYWRSFIKVLFHLDALLRDQRHNLEMRERREDIILDFVEPILYEANRLQTLPAGWSKDTELTEEQAVWLDAAYSNRRQTDTDWIWPVCMDFSRWLVNAYEWFCHIEKRKEISLSDAELHSFASTMEAVLKQEVREG